MRTRQSEEKRHEIKVGALILIGLAVTIFAILSVTQQRGLFQDRYQLKIHMSRVNGLQTGAPVRLAGVRVGSVVKVEFTKNTLDPIIEVVIEVEKKVQQRIRKDSEAHIGTLGLLGDKFIGITMAFDHNTLQADQAGTVIAPRIDACTQSIHRRAREKITQPRDPGTLESLA